ncbi:hypothetical protein [Pseudobutyrivibrio ruminis]|uniref:Glycosyltransferase RgtA/B/C/D-like domain-containing protein n=1 Tax=Pseudobutyrivibrio ruminis TaxID=46206 RepID=A0A2G3DYN7_9FIRM|nr:hypothetical protein [Pseudobutyrivibrio ruminis]PHU36158.1 hypothetical protein CSX01_01215 [Pseudobutyrivibrio ruminis]
MYKKFDKVFEEAKNNNLYSVLVLLALASFAIAIYYLFTYGIAYLHADVSISYRYARAMEWSKNLFPPEWKFVNSEVYTFRVTPVAAFISLIVKDQVVGRVVADVIFLIFTLAGILFLFKKQFKTKGASIVILIFILFLGGIETRNMILNEGTYMSEMLAITLSVPLVYFYLSENAVNGENRKRVYITSLILYCLLVFVMIAGGVRYIAEQVLPMAAAICIYQFLKRKEIKNVMKEVAVPLVGLFVSAGLGWCVYKWICSTHFMNTGGMDAMVFPHSFAVLFENIKMTILQMLKCFGFVEDAIIASGAGVLNIISIITVLTVCIIIPIMQLIKFPKESDNVKFFIVFAVCHNATLLGVAILLGKNIERYLLSSIYVFILVSARFIYEYYIKENRFKYIAICIIAVLSLIEATHMIKITRGWDDIYASHMRVVKELEDRGYEKGYGGYWTALMYEVYANGDITFGEVDIRKKAQPWTWNIDFSVYGKKSDTSFLMLTEKELNLMEKELDSYFGEAKEYFVVDDVYLFDYTNLSYYIGDLYIYGYDYDIYENFADGFADGVVTAKDLYFAEGGMIYEDGSCYVYSLGRLMGPYTRIEKGSYEVVYNGENVDELLVDIQSAQNPTDISYEIVEVTDSQIVVNLTVNKTIDDIDFCAIVVGENPVKFEGITVNKI